MKLPSGNLEEGGMTSNHHGLYAQGYTRATMAVQRVSNTVMGANPQKPSQFGL